MKWSVSLPLAAWPSAYGLWSLLSRLSHFLLVPWAGGGLTCSSFLPLCLTKVYLSAGLGLGVAPSLGLLTSSESSAAPSAHFNVLMLGSLFCFPPQIGCESLGRQGRGLVQCTSVPPHLVQSSGQTHFNIC